MPVDTTASILIERLEYGSPPLVDVFAGVDFHGFGSVFNFPHGKANTWFRSNPVLFNERVSRRDGVLDGRLSALLRMLETWNQHRQVKLKSFQLDAMAAREYSDVRGLWPYELAHFFEAGAAKGLGFLRASTFDGFYEDMSADMSDDLKAHIVHELEWATNQMRRGLSANERGEDDAALDSFAAVFGPSLSALH